MTTKLATLFTLITCLRPAAAQNLDLARRLASPTTRQAAIDEIKASHSPDIAQLLAWTVNPPPGVNRTQLLTGLANIFADLKTKEAIPFLIDNLSLADLDRPDIWMKTPEVIEAHFPAARALINIGPDACRVLIYRDPERMPLRDFLVAVFVVSRVKASPSDARDFLNFAVGSAGVIRFWAEDGLKSLGN